MKKFLSKLHLWVSVPFGLVITITCFTGAMLVFESEITALCSGGASSVEPKGSPMPVWQIIERVEPYLDSGVEVTGVVIPFAADEAYKVNLSKPRRAALYVNQYTGEVQGEYRRPPFFDVMRRLHRWLMDSNPGHGAIFWGKVIVGASTLAFAVILLTGAVIWWPRNHKMLRNRLKIVVSKGKNRFWYDLHAVGGMYVLIFLLILALTGLTWSFPWYKTLFYSIFDNVPRSMIYSIHVGSWGGMVTRILTFIAALIGATLPITGYYLWIKRILAKKKKKLIIMVCKVKVVSS